jgi:outer membrane usher protein
VETTSARADGWGPALVSRIPVYTDSTLPIDVADLPIGYSLGAGTFDLHPSYQSGQLLEVGSDHSVTIYGRLETEGGEPVGLVMGEAYRSDDPGRHVQFFTNASGKFAAEGLSPGRWILQAETEHEPTFFEFEIPAGTEGLHQTGTLSPTGRI